MVDYSKWDNIEVSDNEDEGHPNVDQGSLNRWRHESRVERMEQASTDREDMNAMLKANRKAIKELDKKMTKTSDARRKKDLKSRKSALKKERKKLKADDAELRQKEEKTPLNVDTISRPGFEKSVINRAIKAEPERGVVQQVFDEVWLESYAEYMQRNMDDLKHFAFIAGNKESERYLRQRPHLVCDHAANFLSVWCVDLVVENKHEQMTKAARQAIVMRYLLEILKSLKADTHTCIALFYSRIRVADKTYMTAYQDEVKCFIERVEELAEARFQEALQDAERTRQKRLGPDGLDPVDVYRTLPPQLQKAVDSRDIAAIAQCIRDLPVEEAKDYTKAMLGSGIWSSEPPKKIGPDGTLIEQEEDYETIKSRSVDGVDYISANTIIKAILADSSASAVDSSGDATTHTAGSDDLASEACAASVSDSISSDDNAPLAAAAAAADTSFTPRSSLGVAAAYDGPTVVGYVTADLATSLAYMDNASCAAAQAAQAAAAAAKSGFATSSTRQLTAPAASSDDSACATASAAAASYAEADDGYDDDDGDNDDGDDDGDDDIVATTSRIEEIKFDEVD